MTCPVDFRTSLKPRAGLALERLGLTVFITVVLSCTDNDFPPLLTGWMLTIKFRGVYIFFKYAESAN